MLHRTGEMEEWRLAHVLRDCITLYRKGQSEVVYVSFWDVPMNKKRWVKYQLLAGQWCFVDITEKAEG